VAVLTVLADFGFRQSANVYSGHHEEWTSYIHSILLKFTLISWLAVSIVGGAVILLLRNLILPGFPVRWILVSLLILSLSLYANRWNGMMIGRGRIWQLNFVQFVVSTLTLALIVVFVVGLSGGVLSAVIIYSVTTVVQVLMMLGITYRTRVACDQDQIPSDLQREMLSFGLRGHPGAVSTLLWANAPVFLLNAFYGTTAVGIFSVAQQIVEKLLLPIQAMLEAIFKKISVLPREAAIAAMNRYLRIAWWMTVTSMVAGVLLMPWVVRFLFGTKYLAVTIVARWLFPGTAAISIPFLLTAYFLSQLRRPGLLSIFGWLNVIVNVVLSLLLIPRMVEIGAALAMTFSQIFGAACSLIAYLRLTGTQLGDLVHFERSDLQTVRGQIDAILSNPGD